MLKSTLTLLLLSITILSGCATVRASGPQPFPAIPPEGGTVRLDPGVYNCPANIPSSTHIIGDGSITPDEVGAFDGSIVTNGHARNVRILCSRPVVLKNLTDVQISGVIFDFQHFDAGMIIEGTVHSEFSMGIAHTGNVPALELSAHHGNNFANRFSRLMLYDVEQGLKLDGGNDGFLCCAVVTANVFDFVEIMNVHQYGINISQWADTNYFHNVQILGLASDAIAGVVFNDNAVPTDIDADGNVFQEMYINEADQSNPVACGVRFRGTTLGNYVFLSFGILPDANKFCVEPGFHTDELHRLNEWPKSATATATTAVRRQ